MHHLFCTPLVGAMALAVLAVPAGAANNINVGAGTPDDTVQLSLEDLMQVEVTSVSKKPQKLAHVAASVHVIHADDIHRSGANSLAEVLRLAPGMDATRLSGNRWAISARGFAELFAEKLLVLVDGRSAFNPAFSGVSWQDFQFPLEDIERIEVIRGPAASIWGSNGMNGVINIISKSAASTQGGAAVIGTGTVEGRYGRARWGGVNASGNVFYRVYGSTQRARAQDAVPGLGGGNGQDAHGHQAAGLRVDGYLEDGARWDISA
ncbi:MAG: TonB-dependent receptor plug domain-containing protein, partial [Simplicispira sp.]|nr:TonB-dependent receptor plug domain-containing protein [Simplicispira sp.]